LALSCCTWSTIATGSTNERNGLSTSTPSSSNFSQVSAPGMPFCCEASLHSSQNGRLTDSHPGTDRSASSSV
jgi:hypothetical protein